MRAKLSFLTACIISLACTPSVLTGQSRLSERVTDYTMDVSLDVSAHQLTGHTTLTWRNPSADTVPSLMFHLYLNAFRNTSSTWMQEGEEFIAFMGSDWLEACNWGDVTITAMHDIQNRDLTQGFAFRQPEDANPDDLTVLEVALPEPVLPRDSIIIEFDWNARIPKAMVRTGYNRDFYFLAQWFPKLGVYEPAGMRYADVGSWNCHQYHANSEYYADFGTYRVNLTVPDQFIVGASGVLTDKKQTDGAVTWSYLAEDVIDFAWTASPHFIVLEEEYRDKEIALMVYPEHEQYADDFMDPLRFAMDYMQDYFGPYPYPRLTVVGAPIHGIFAGAMEYPTLITSFSTAVLPDGFKSTQTLVVHEFVHQYFMQIIATNEQEEAWMDEGITSYYEAEILNAFYGEKTSMIDMLGMRVGNLENARHEFLRSGFAQSAPATLPTWEFHPTANSVISYDKTALWLKTLEGLLGEDVMKEAMRAYFNTWKFRHPCAEDFRQSVNAVVAARYPDRWPEGMDWFFDQVLNGTELCDYKVVAIQNAKELPRAGRYPGSEDCVVPATDGAERFKSTAILQRTGGLTIPVDILVRFDDETSLTEAWDGKEPTRILSYTGTRKIREVQIDPDFRNKLDVDVINNSRTVQAQSRGLFWYAGVSLLKLQHLLESMTFFA